MNKYNKFKLERKLIPIKNEIRKLGNSRISVKTKRRLLSSPQVGHGILSAIASDYHLLYLCYPKVGNEKMNSISCGLEYCTTSELLIYCSIYIITLH